MDELDALRKRRLQRLVQEQQAKAAKQADEEAELQKQIEQLEAFVKTIFTRDALDRYSNLKLAHPEKAVKVLVVLAQGMQKSGIKQVDGEQLKKLLIRLEPEKKEFKLKR